MFKVIRVFIIVSVCIVLVVSGYMLGFHMRTVNAVLSLNDLAKYDISNTQRRVTLLCLSKVMQKHAYDFKQLSKNPDFYPEYKYCVIENLEKGEDQW